MPDHYAKSTALVTGASSGIGAAFARELAARGADLVLVARSTDRLDALAHELRAQHRVTARVITADLSDPRGVRHVQEKTSGVRIDILVNNAGFATHGALVTLDPARDHTQVLVDVLAVTDLVHALVPAMVDRGRGLVVNVASTGGLQPLPYMATYGASKAFVVSFSEALREEVRDSGVRVVTLCPGATETPFFDHVGPEASVSSRRASPATVVATALRTAERGGGFVIVGLAERALALLPRFLPRSLVARIAARMLRPATAATLTSRPVAR